MKNNPLSRRDFIKISGLTLAGSATNMTFFSRTARALASCDQLQGETIRWIVPTRTGGGYDTYSRLFEPFLENVLGSNIIIENIPGAGTLIGSRKLMKSDPDGLTLGILNGPGLLAASLTSDTASPHPANDFTVLGRISRSRQVWATSGKSSITSIFDILAPSRKKPPLCAITDVGSTNFINFAITSSLLGIEVEPVAGFKGSRSCMMSAIRGEVDLVIFSFESGHDLIKSGDLRPLLQISSSPVSSDPSLGGIPILGGKNGIAALRAAESGRKTADAIAGARSLEGLTGAGRIIAAPLIVDHDLNNCLQKRIFDALSSPGLQAAAEITGKTLDIADAADTMTDLEAVATYMDRFSSIVQRAIQKVRS